MGDAASAGDRRSALYEGRNDRDLPRLANAQQLYPHPLLPDDRRRHADLHERPLASSAADLEGADVVIVCAFAVEDKVNAALGAGAIPIVIGQNSPCGSGSSAHP